jgi:hypothetical protein
VRLWRRRLAIGIYVTLVATLVGVIIAASLHVLDGQWAAATAVAVAILTALNASSQREAVQSPPEEKARKLASELAPQILDEWTEEMLSRGLEPDRRMALRWRLGAGSNPSAQAAAGLADEGTLDQLLNRIGHDADDGRLPRLVVTGEMGGGKTAACVLLVVELVERHGRLPVLLQLGTWDPGTSLQAWIANQLPEVFPVLGRTRNDQKVAAILASRHALPILDGLDEMREPAAALRAIDEEMRGRPFVVTCRTAEFARANAGGVLHQALVVELQPLRPDEVSGILLEYEPAGVQGPLAPLVGALKDQPAGPVADALSTPFMVSLARDTDASLGELLPTATDPNAADVIRQHLLGTFVSKTYATRTAYADSEGITPDQARRYLRFLARHTDPAGRLAWWRLDLAVPQVVFLVVSACFGAAVCSGLATLFFSLFDRPWLGFWIGLGAGAAGAITDKLVPRDPPRRSRPRVRSVQVPAPPELAHIIGFGLVGGAALAVMVWILYASSRYIIIGGVLSGVTFTIARYVSQPNDPLKVITPASLLSADRAAVLYAWLVGAIPGALTGAYLGFSFRAGHRPGYDSLGILSYPTPVLALLGAASGCVLSGTGLGLMALGSSSWGRFNFTRLWLAGHGWTPLRLMSFLEDAHKRGVLRQVNGYYEFRHQMLQRYLGEPGSRLPAGTPGALASPGAPP